MLLHMNAWQLIRGQFSEEEKDSLNAAVTGETICPRACVLDENRLSDELRHKLHLAMKEPRP